MTVNTDRIDMAQAPGMLEKHHFLIRKIHSLTGLLPIGFFLAFHLYENAYIFSGPKAWDKGTSWILKMPLVGFIEISVLAIPILFHGIYGLWIYYTGQSNIDIYKTKYNYGYFIQRLSGLITFIFLIYHVGSTRIYSIIRDEHISGAFMQNYFGNYFNLIFYIIGISAASYHFGNGLWNMGITWGFTIGKHAQKVWWYICTAIGLGLAVLGIAVAIAFSFQLY